MLKLRTLGLLLSLSFFNGAFANQIIDNSSNCICAYAVNENLAKDTSRVCIYELIPQIGDSEIGLDSLQSIRLICYPNTTESMSNILFTLAKSDQVKITVFNKKGCLVKELINEKKTAGQHEYPVDFSSYKKGLYFITLQTIDRERSFPLFIY